MSAELTLTCHLNLMMQRSGCFVDILTFALKTAYPSVLLRIMSMHRWHQKLHHCLFTIRCV